MNSHIGHRTHASESSNVESTKQYDVGNNITCTINCHYRIAATLYTVETLFVSDMYLQIPCIMVINNNNNNNNSNSSTEEHDESAISAVVICIHSRTSIQYG